MIPANGDVIELFQPQLYSTLLPTDSIVGIHSPESAHTQTDTTRNEYSNGTFQTVSEIPLTNWKYYECYLCNCIKPRKVELINHFRGAHTGDRPHKCDECDKSFTNKSLLKQHSQSHSDIRPFKCNDCDKSFKTKPVLNQHVETHGERKFKCDHKGCDKSFKKKIYLKQHSAIHSNRRPFKCNRGDCKKSFKTYPSLRQHVQSHGERKFKCDHEDCDKKFKRKIHLAVHRTRHLNKRSFKCDQRDCNQTFKERSSLHYHKINHLKRILYRTNNNNEYSVTQCKNDVIRANCNYLCDECPNGFVEEGQLIFHFRDVHNRDIVYCNICDAPLENEDSRREHVVNQHLYQD